MMDEIRPGRMGDFYYFNPFNETMPHDSFFLFAPAHTPTNYPRHSRADAAEYVTSVFSYVPVDSLLPTKSSAGIDQIKM